MEAGQTQVIPIATIISWILTILGWVVTLSAAIIPLRGVKKKQDTFEQELEKLKSIRAESIDHAMFQKDKQHLIKKLSDWQQNLELGNIGLNSLHKLEQTITRIEVYAKTLRFDENDQKTIERFKSEISRAMTTKETQRFSKIANGEIEKIKMVLQKGAYQVW